MKITLSPIASQTDDTPPSVNGEVLIYRGEDYDLSQLPNGGEVEAESPFVGKIKRDDNGVVSLTLQYRYRTDNAETIQSTDINDYMFDVTSGECRCPIKRKPESMKEASE